MARYFINIKGLAENELEAEGVAYAHLLNDRRALEDTTYKAVY